MRLLRTVHIHGISELMRFVWYLAGDEAMDAIPQWWCKERWENHELRLWSTGAMTLTPRGSPIRESHIYDPQITLWCYAGDHPDLLKQLIGDNPR